MYFFKVAWRKWLGFARIIGNFQSQVVFSLFYLLMLSIVGIIFRFFVDPLNIKTKKFSNKRSNFYSWQHQNDNIIDARKQF